MEKVAVHSAIDRCITTLVRLGETDEAVLRTKALQTVAGESQGSGAFAR